MNWAMNSGSGVGGGGGVGGGVGLLGGGGVGVRLHGVKGQMIIINTVGICIHSRWFRRRCFGCY